jgi:CDP-glucose 4,6-dehydratase
MHYMITGHTGFKGAWLTLMLTREGHQVSGLSLDPEPGSLYETANLRELVTHDLRGDIRSPETVLAVLEDTSPDAVYHLAAQPLVRESYRDPRTTIETNVMGTYNVIDAISSVASFRNHHDRQGLPECEPATGIHRD